MRERPRAGGPSRIALDGAFEDWAAVTPEYRDTIGDTVHRDHPGYGSLVYRNATGRNDFVIAKAAYDPNLSLETSRSFNKNVPDTTSAGISRS